MGETRDAETVRDVRNLQQIVTRWSAVRGAVHEDFELLHQMLRKSGWRKPKKVDLTPAIRKIERRATHHRAVADADYKWAEQCGDKVEEDLWRKSADDRTKTAESYEAALAILKDHHSV